MAWYANNHRDLPWRRTHDPYRIWVSEIMLQQTQVKTVLPRYESWFERFPTIASLAVAHLDDVLKAWEGLGYYRRARFIHAASQHIMQAFQGKFPQAFDDILALSGIGRSTAGAISSFCFQTATPVLDGNVKRVLKRWQRDELLKDKELWHLAKQAIEQADDAALWNQAMMELGATVCSVRQPDCASCSVSKYCLSAFDVQENIPAKKVLIKDVYWQIHIHRDLKKGLFLQQRPSKGIWAGLWTPPIVELQDKPTEKADHIHILTHRRLHLHAVSHSVLNEEQGKWFQNLDDIALPTGIHRLLSTLHLSE